MEQDQKRFGHASWAMATPRQEKLRVLLAKETLQHMRAKEMCVKRKRDEIREQVCVCVQVYCCYISLHILNLRDTVNRWKHAEMFLYFNTEKHPSISIFICPEFDSDPQEGAVSLSFSVLKCIMGILI